VEKVVPDEVKNNITTEEHFATFKAECQKWIEIFGLKGWRIEYKHSGSDPNSRAWCELKWQSRCGTIALTRDWGEDKISAFAIKQCAFHEVCEVLLERMKWIAERRQFSEWELLEANHEVIRILENAVWEKF
jgi:hypothetical protein